MRGHYRLVIYDYDGIKKKKIEERVVQKDVGDVWGESIVGRTGMYIFFIMCNYFNYNINKKRERQRKKKSSSSSSFSS